MKKYKISPKNEFLMQLEKENKDWRNEKDDKAMRLELTKDAASAWFIFADQDTPMVLELENLIFSVAKDEWGQDSEVSFDKLNKIISISNPDGRRIKLEAPNRMNNSIAYEN